MTIREIRMEKLNESTRKSLSFAWGVRIRLHAEGDKLWAEGDKLWAEAILEFVGNIKLEWRDGKCILETGDIFEP